MNFVEKTHTSSTPKGSSSACASRITSLLLVLFKAVVYLIHPILRFLHPTIPASSKRRSANDELMVIKIEEYHVSNGKSTLNKVFEASEHYLHHRMSPSTRLFKIAQTQKETKFSIDLSNKQEFEDIYEGIQMKWKYHSRSKKSNNSSIAVKKQFFELILDVKHKNIYSHGCLLVPYVVETFKAMKDAQKIVKLHTLPRSDAHTVMIWSAINLKHPV